MTLSHADDTGTVHMVDVGAKPVSERVATATGVVRCSEECFEALRTGAVAKGDVLTTARLAGIMAAKRTPELIPLCHPVALTHVEVSVELDDATRTVIIAATARCTGQTGVEMEALTAVAVAALTVIDMAKAVDPWMSIDAVALQHKQGGRSGRRDRPS